mmetsp:Transcript_27189/g.49424  ORF Transcript_27189/g.49424 Transcript_27189/m.49424 type:complete len:161 (-) Transcript_27189:250-732(-)
MSEVQEWDQQGGDEPQQQQPHGNQLEEEEDDIFAEENDQGNTPEGALLMRFCPHDSSMLYPKEDKRSKTLRYACRICRYSEASQGSMIYRNVLKKEVGNVLHTVPSAVSDDPTLPRSQNAPCENCRQNEAVFFQSDTTDVRNATLALIFVCCNCGHKWVA